MKKVCIVGAGAIGGLIGTRLAAAGGSTVSALARGATLVALREHGWRLHSGGDLITAPVIASNQPADLGPQDLVIIAVKAPAMSDIAARIAPLLAPHTVVLPAMNGVPWWFAEGVDSLQGCALNSVDPGGRIAQAIAFERVLGAVVHISAATAAPGLVSHKMGRGLIVGEPRGGRSPRAQKVVELLCAAGFEATHSPQIRSDIWYKLWGNMTVNPVSAITGALTDRMHADPLVMAFCSAAMREASRIGERIGCPIEQTPEDRQAVTARLGAFKSSMLQDVEAGRPIELDAIVTAVHEMGRHLQVETPNVDALLGLTRLFAQGRGLYPGA